MKGCVASSGLVLFLLHMTFVAGAERNASSGVLLTNAPPRAALTFPNASRNIVQSGTQVHLKADAFDLDGSVQLVKFFVSTNFIGFSGTPPYSVVWIPPRVAGVERFYGTELSVEVADNLGATSRSEMVPITIIDGPQPRSYVKLLTPRDGDVFPAPATFDIHVEVLVTFSADPLSFLVGTNRIAANVDRSDTATVTNLAEGDYVVKVDGFFCDCPDPIKIRVAKAGITRPVRQADGSFRFSGFTTVQSKQTVIESSTNLLNWSPIATNSPSPNSFHFIAPLLPNPPSRFYRLLLEP